MSLIKKMFYPLKAYYLQKLIDSERVREEQIVVRNFKPDCFTPLSKQEKQSILNLWGGISKHISFKEYEAFKKVNGFDPKYLSHNLYLPLISRRLNDYYYTNFFENKGLLGYLTQSEKLLFPYCYVRCINGEYYTNDMHQITQDEAIEICSNQDNFIVKSSRFTSGGQGVRLYRLADMSNDKRKSVCKDILNCSSDFVIQELLRQHIDMAKFNASSVNTLRVTSLYLNGVATIQNIILRIGKPGSYVDNMASGGLVVGVATDGKLNEYAFGLDLERTADCNGITFKDARLQFVPEVLEMVISAHKDIFPLCKFIGWDVCIDETGKPVIIEVNTSQPGISGEQLCGGPIFGHRTEEVIDYCLQKPFKYGRGIINI